MLSKLQSIVFTLSASIICAMALVRLINARSSMEMLLSAFVAIVFGWYSISEIFEARIKSSEFYKRHGKSLYKSKVVDYVFILVGLIVFAIMFFLYSPDNKWVGAMRLFVIFIFLLGVIVLCWRIIHHLRNRRE